MVKYQPVWGSNKSRLLQRIYPHRVGKQILTTFGSNFSKFRRFHVHRWFKINQAIPNWTKTAKKAFFPQSFNERKSRIRTTYLEMHPNALLKSINKLDKITKCDWFPFFLYGFYLFSMYYQKRTFTPSKIGIETNIIATVSISFRSVWFSIFIHKIQLKLFSSWKVVCLFVMDLNSMKGMFKHNKNFKSNTQRFDFKRRHRLSIQFINGLLLKI